MRDASASVALKRVLADVLRLLELQVTLRQYRFRRCYQTFRVGKASNSLITVEKIVEVTEMIIKKPSHGFSLQATLQYLCWTKRPEEDMLCQGFFSLKITYGFL